MTEKGQKNIGKDGLISPKSKTLGLDVEGGHVGLELEKYLVVGVGAEVSGREALKRAGFGCRATGSLAPSLEPVGVVSGMKNHFAR